MADQPIDLDRLQALHDAATPGPWEAVDCDNGKALLQRPHLLPRKVGHSTELSPGADSFLIVAMRNALPALLAEVRALREERERTEAALRRLSAHSLCDTSELAVFLDMVGLLREPKETP